MYNKATFMKILGIETSCDETAAAVVESGSTLLSNVVASSMDLHKVYGGVVPEIAARSHIEAMMPVVEQALTEAKCVWDDIDGIAVTYGPGLGGSLLVGVLTARTLAITKQKPLYAVNHVTAHCFANFLTSTSLNNYALPPSPPQFPVLALIVSGGHTQLVLFMDYFDYQILGQTGDDAIGEAFDKVAKILGLPYPGGPSIQAAATAGDDQAYRLPKARLDQPYDFSFSGLKTAVLRTAQAVVGETFTFPSHQIAPLLSEQQVADLAASFQRVAVETVVDKTLAAFEEFQPRSVIIAGGVAASTALRQELQERLPIEISYTDLKLCTDNGAMIAACGSVMAAKQTPTADPFSLDIVPNLSM